MMLRQRTPEVLAGADLPESYGMDIDRVLVLDHLCCTAVALRDGQVRAVVVASSRAAALQRLSRRVGRATSRATPV